MTRVLKSGRIQQKTDTEQNWIEHDPEILQGEICVSTFNDGTVKIKIADKDNKWSNVPYLSGGGSGGDTLWTRGNDGTSGSVIIKGSTNTVDSDNSIAFGSNNEISYGANNSSILAGENITASEKNTAYAQNIAVTQNLTLSEYTDPVSGKTYPEVNVRELTGGKQSDWNTTDTEDLSFIKNKPFNAVDDDTISVVDGILKANIAQSNYTQETTTAVDYIKNRPTISAEFQPRQNKKYALLMTDTNLFSTSTTSSTLYKAMTPYNYNNGDNYYMTVEPIYSAGSAQITMSLGSINNNVKGQLTLEGKSHFILQPDTNRDTAAGSTYNIQLQAKTGTIALLEDLNQYQKTLTPGERITINDNKISASHTQSDWAENDDTKDAYINNRTHHDTIGYSKVCTNTAYDFTIQNNGTAPVFVNPPDGAFIEGNVVKINVGGNEYEGTVKYDSAHTHLTYLGNLYVYDSTYENTGEDYFFYISGDYILMKNATGADIINKKDETFLYKYVNLKQLDSKYVKVDNDTIIVNSNDKLEVNVSANAFKPYVLDITGSSQLLTPAQHGNETYDEYYAIKVNKETHKKEIVASLFLMDATGDYVLADMNINKDTQEVTIYVDADFTGRLVIA